MTQGRSPAKLLANERANWLLLRAFAVFLIVLLLSEV